MTSPHPSPLSSLPLSVWLGPVLALRLHEVGMDLMLRRRAKLTGLACVLVRGLLGEQLRAAWCLTGAPQCTGCPVAGECDFARFFHGGGPHPFWLQGVPADDVLPAGRRVQARLCLLPPLHRAAPLLTEALQRALLAVLPAADLVRTQQATLPVAALLPEVSGGAVRLWTETPLDLRGSWDLCRTQCPQAPWFALLLRAGVRRLDGLLRLCRPPEEPVPRVALPDLRGLQVQGRLVPWRGSRYSHRQEQRLLLRGLVGEVLLQGDPVPEVLPLLRVLAVTGVGKATAFGLGSMRLESGS
ncbi:MAG: CRISPR system precrRNA processing endoribonuclease RAMP protein Cas6 [Myxococcales bacterium]|nr:CRISPR system precrRNA processing endoribonuclease RAMP protein Cas6 [Myxococcota bacterium]MDW8284372.1 CRISPR system precrRNA processing endoribonuclease RAMP protein Cas6 [Myxococcales bacterium]